MTYVQTAKLTDDIITLEEVKQYIKVDFDDEDTLIQSLINASVTIAEKWMNRDILTTTYFNYRDSFIQDLTLRRGGYQSVDLVEYLSDDVYTTLATTQYTVRIGGTFGIICEIDPANHDDDCNAIRITFKTGFGDDATAVPSPIKDALLDIVSNLYQNRASCADGAIPLQAQALLYYYRIIDIVGAPGNVCV